MSFLLLLLLRRGMGQKGVENLNLPDRPDILMITCEDMSPIIPTYGDFTVKTPNIDRLAKEGVKYRNTPKILSRGEAGNLCVRSGLK